MHSVVSSQAFATAWVQVNTVAHQALVKVLSGQGGGAISTSNGQIVLNLGPLIAVAKQDLVAKGFKLASSIPPVTPTLALFQAKDLGKAQGFYRLVKAGKIVLPILVLLILAAGVYVARGRRRALIGAGLGLVASMLVLAIPVSVLGVWAGNEVSDTGRWVATVEPLVHDPAMQNYLTDQITNQITSRINITGTVNQAAAQLNSRGLPKISSLLNQFAPQIASSVTGFIHSTVHSVVSSQAFATAWVQVNTVAHQALVKVLSGQGGGAISTSNGQIVLNLGPLIAVAKQDLVAKGFKLASSIPPVTPTLALFQAKDLGKAQGFYRLVKAGKIVLPILVLLILAAGVYVARGRLAGPDRSRARPGRVHAGPRHRLGDRP